MMPEQTTVLKIRNVSKQFSIGFVKNQSLLNRLVSVFSGREPRRKFNALEDVSFDLQKGDLLGIIGGNGSGKSTLLRIISGIYKPDSGSVATAGKTVALINLGVGIKDRLTMKDNILLLASLFGISRKNLDSRYKDIVEFSGLEKFINTKIYQFSAGMVQKLIFSVVVFSEPDILLLDEVFEIGDEEFRKKSVDKMKELNSNGVAIILVSHDINLVKKYCSRALWIKDGKISKAGNVDEVTSYYLNDFEQKKMKKIV